MARSSRTDERLRETCYRRKEMNRHGQGWKSAVWIFGLAAAIFVVPSRPAIAAEGVALAIVYDTSGSMLQQVRDREGNLTPKHVIASRALTSVLDRLEALTSGSEGSPLLLHAGLIVFHGDNASFAVPFGPYKAQAYRNWLNGAAKPQAGTPLGEAVRVGGRAVLNSALPRKHLLIITDGINTRGPTPASTMKQLLRDAKNKETGVSVHFIAFDVQAAVFSDVKGLGATVVGAADEKQLNSQLEFILEKKILLEDEEPPLQPSKN
jgi:hypothetical protein